jgi:hypothetical protein
MQSTTQLKETSIVLNQTWVKPTLTLISITSETLGGGGNSPDSNVGQPS